MKKRISQCSRSIGYYMSRPLLLALLMTIFVSLKPQKAGAQTLNSLVAVYYCGLSGDTMTTAESGYLAGDSILFYFGDGTSMMEGPEYPSGYYSLMHNYASPGTYTVKEVLIRGGLRLDSATIITTYVPCSYISLVVYNDVNSDCVDDAGDGFFSASPAEVEVDSDGHPVDTQWVSHYMYYLGTGPVGTVYTFKIIGNPFGFAPSCPTSGTMSTTITSSYASAIDTIGFTCSPTACTDNSVVGYSGDYALYEGWLYAAVYSSKCSATTATLDISFSPKYHFLYASGAPYTVSGNVVTFNITGLSSFSPAYLNLHVAPTGTLSFGDTTHTTFKLYPYTGDCDTANNYVFSVDTIYKSFDPNHKSVSPNGDITAGTSLTYTLEFVNTGNDTAFNIHIMDTLSDNLDIRTLKLMGASPKCAMTTSAFSGHNVVKFDFPGINLLDSAHCNQCNGSVTYSINAKSALAAGTTIDNEAGIYFDDNPVVMTNPVENVIGSKTGTLTFVNNSSVEVYPNPVNGNLNIKAGAGQYDNLTICNTFGQYMYSSNIKGGLTQVNVSALPAGMYYVTLKGNNGVKVVKFEKL